MKLLFTALLLSIPVCASAAKPGKPEAAAPAPSAEAPRPPRPPTPGFWERAWDSTKKGTQRIGTKTAELVKAPFGGKKKATETKPLGALSMSVAIEPAQVKLSENRSVKVIVTVINKGKFAAQLDFPTTQRIEVLVKSDAGKVLSKWSDDQKVDKEQGFLVINPDERLEYSATISTRNMAPGQSYVIEAYFPSFETLHSSRTVSPVK